MNPTIDNPKVFISYAWASEEYQNKVLALAHALIDDGVDVIFDKWSLKEGNDTYAFMEKSVTDTSITSVLILLDPMYEEKANNRAGGVGTETQIISAEVYNKVTQEKFLPVIFERHSNGAVPKPAYLRGLLHFDLTNPDTYDNEYQRLVRRLFGIDTYVKPEVGTPPLWLTSSPPDIKKKIKIEELKKQSIPSNMRVLELRGMLSEKAVQLIDFGNDFDQALSGPSSDYIKLMEQTIPLRDDILLLFSAGSAIPEGHKEIASVMDDIAIGINSKHDNSYLNEIRKTVLHELFIYLIAIYYKSKNNQALSYTLNKTYFADTAYTTEGASSFNTFYNNNSTLDQAVCNRDGKKYYSGTAQFWMEHINIDFCTKSEFVFADILCHNASIIIENYQDMWFWFPLSYVYGGARNQEFMIFAKRLISREWLNDGAHIFGFSSSEDLVKKLTEWHQQVTAGAFKEYRYSASFESVPTIFDYIQINQIGTRN